MITAGIDVGAKFAKIVILNDGKVLAKAKALVGFDVLKSANNLLEDVLKASGLSRNDIKRVAATGMGRKAVYSKPINISDNIQPQFQHHLLKAAVPH